MERSTRGAMRLKGLFCILCACPLLVCNAGTVRLFGGETQEGRIGLESGGITVTPEHGAASTLDLANVLDAVFLQAPARDQCPPGALLTNGSFIAGAIGPLDGPAIKVGRQAISVPVSAIARVSFAVMPPEKVFQAPNGPAGAMLANGDFFAGTFTGIKQGGVVIDSVIFGPQRFARGTQAIAVVLRDVQTNPARYEVSTRDGSRFLADDLTLDTGGLLLRDTVAGQVRIKSEDLCEIRAGSGRYQLLTDLKPIQADAPAGTGKSGAEPAQSPSATEPEEAASLQTAANVAVSYSIPSGLSLFSCRGTAPKENAPATRLAFAVYADGRLIIRSRFLGPGENLDPVRVNLGAARVLTLRVESLAPPAGAAFGQWIEPILLRP